MYWPKEKGTNNALQTQYRKLKMAQYEPRSITRQLSK